MFQKMRDLFQSFVLRLPINRRCKFVVFMPCILVCTALAAGNERAELLDGGGLIFERLIDDVVKLNKSIRINGSRANGSSLDCECASKLCDCRLPLISFGDDSGKTVSNEGPAQSAKKCEAAGNEGYFVGSKLHFWLSAFVGWAIGTVVAIPLCWLSGTPITQRKKHNVMSTLPPAM